MKLTRLAVLEKERERDKVILYINRGQKQER